MRLEDKTFSFSHVSKYKNTVTAVNSSNRMFNRKDKEHITTTALQYFTLVKLI